MFILITGKLGWGNANQAFGIALPNSEIIYFDKSFQFTDGIIAGKNGLCFKRCYP